MNAYSDLDPRERQTARNEQRPHKLLEQRVIAAIMLILSIVFVWMTSAFNEDCSGGLFVGAISLYLLFTKNVVICE